MKLMTLERSVPVEAVATAATALRSGNLCVSCEDGVVTLPDGIAKAVECLLDGWASGSTVTLVSHRDLLTTQQVADIMQVSRPFVTRLVDRGLLACVRVGKHRRVSAASVIDYLEHSRQAAVSALAVEAQQNVADNLY